MFSESIERARSLEQPPAATVVIPSWNGKHLLEAIALPSLAAQTFRDFVTLVVDNGSTDGSESLETSNPEIKVERLQRNVGFAAAVNSGIALARSEFIVLLNNDVELDARWLEEMVAAAREHPYAASLACRIMDFEDRTLISSAGDCVSPAATVFWRGWNKRYSDEFARAQPVFSACAAAALYRKAAFEVVGPFDDEFFAYLEDVDWGFRAQLMGFECWYVPTAVAFHIGGATSARAAGSRRALRARNTYWLVIKDFPSDVVLRHAASITFVLVREFYRLFRDGHRRRVCSSLVEALHGTPAAFRKRRRIRATASITSAELVRRMEPPGSLGSQKLVAARSLLRAARGRSGPTSNSPPA